MHVSIGDIILIEIKMCHLPYFVLIFSHVSMSPLFSLRAEVTRIMYKYEKLSYRKQPSDETSRCESESSLADPQCQESTR